MTTSYIVWAANQVGQRTSEWFAKNPAEASLLAAALANPATRGFVSDVLKVVAKESIKSNINIARGIGTSLVNRSTIANRTASTLRTLGAGIRNLILRHPVATVAVAYTSGAALSISLAQDEDPLTESLQVRAVSQGISGLGQPGVGSWRPF